MYYMLPIVASSIMHAPWPFQSFIGDPLLEAMTAKIEIDLGIIGTAVAVLFVLYSETDIVQALWGDHPAMPTVIDVSDLMNDGEEDDDKEEEDDAFEESYVEKDAVLFFRKVALSNYPSVHQEILGELTYCAVYVVVGKDQTIDKVRIEKILISAWQKQSDRKYKQSKGKGIKKNISKARQIYWMAINKSEEARIQSVSHLVKNGSNQSLRIFCWWLLESC
eukprot:894666_1